MSQTHIEQRTTVSKELEFEAQCEAAIAAHGEWKYKLLKAIENKGEGLDAAKIEVDNQCVFGQWLYSDATLPYRQDGHYEKVRQLHAEFHKQAAAIVRLCHQGQVAQAKQEIAEDSRYSKLSQKLAEAIFTWIKARRGVEVSTKEDTEQVSKTQHSLVKSYAIRGAIYGALFGCCFVVGGIITACLVEGLPLQLMSFVTVHQIAPLQYIIDMAPFVLGTFGYFLGKAFGKNKELILSQEEVIASRTQALRKALNESELIRAHINDGIFLMDRNLQIGQAVSQALFEILETTDISGRSFLQVLKGRIKPEKELEITGYLDLFLNSSHDEEMLRELNPLNPLELSASEGKERKVISIDFVRVKDTGGKVTHLLGIARDITQETLQRERVAQLELERQEEVELIRQILSLGPAVVFEVKEQMRYDAEQISELLKYAEPAELSKTLEAIFRHAHTIKGAASLMGFSELARTAHQYEEKLAEYRQKKEVNSQDLLKLMLFHGDILKALNKIHGAVERIEKFKTETKEQSGFISLLKRAVQAACDIQQKKIELVTNFSDVTGIPPQRLATLRDIFIQLIRNSAAHGIEAPEERIAKGKSEVGKIEISRQVNDKEEIWIYRDDGAGFNVEAIKKKAIQQGLVDSKQAEGLSDSQIVQFIFQPGFSTKEAADMTSGRGVGMDLVSQLVKKQQGLLTLRWRKGEYVEFKIVLPAA